MLEKQREKSEIPLYAAEIGGIVIRRKDGAFVFKKPPRGLGFKAGNIVPPEWDIVPLNDLARREMERIRHH